MKNFGRVVSFHYCLHNVGLGQNYIARKVVIGSNSALKPSFHMVVNVSRLGRKSCRRDRVRAYLDTLDNTCDTVATRSRPYGN